MYERFVTPLDAVALEAYYRDHRAMARLLGVPAALVPGSWSDFRNYFDAMLESDAIAVGATAREIGASVLDPPVKPAGSGLVGLITAALLPPRLREGFGLAWDDARAARLEQLTASVQALRRGGARDSARVASH